MYFLTQGVHLYKLLKHGVPLTPATRRDSFKPCECRDGPQFSLALEKLSFATYSRQMEKLGLLWFDDFGLKMSLLGTYESSGTREVCLKRRWRRLLGCIGRTSARSNAGSGMSLHSGSDFTTAARVSVTSSPSNARVPVSSSNKTHPNDQISARLFDEHDCLSFLIINPPEREAIRLDEERPKTRSTHPGRFSLVIAPRMGSSSGLRKPQELRSRALWPPRTALSCLAPFVAMVQPAHSRKRNDFCGR